MTDYTLGIDTSCDETSAAILKDGKTVISNVISSQIKIHAPHGGVVPELASRSHAQALTKVITQALEKAQITLNDLTGIAVTTSPGLIGCLLVGLSYAKSLSYQLKIPITGVHHLKGHLLSPFCEHEPAYPFIGMVVSGGHTSLYHVTSFDQIKLIGQTVDDACGEAFDKVAKILGLGYPGGPIVDKLAKKGNPHRFKFTRARVKKGPLFLSYSGLKTAVNHLVIKEKESRPTWPLENPTEDQFVIDLCASFQEEAISSLIDKLKLALETYPVENVALSGGVAVNSCLREKIKDLSETLNINALIPSPIMCTDNGAMIAYVGHHQLKQGITANLETNANASLPLF